MLSKLSLPSPGRRDANPVWYGPLSGYSEKTSSLRVDLSVELCQGNQLIPVVKLHLPNLPYGSHQFYRQVIAKAEGMAAGWSSFEEQGRNAL